MIFEHMDGNVSIRELRERIVQTVPGATSAAAAHEIEMLFNLLHPRGYLYLIQAGHYGVSVPDYARLMKTSRPSAG
jgi:hypothetical protein